MGNNNFKAETVTLLKSWIALADEENLALSEGRLQDLEKIIQRSGIIQKKLARIFNDHPELSADPAIKKLIQAIADSRESIAQELGQGSEKIRETLAQLRKGRTSIVGYKQQKTVASRFFNKLT